MRLRSSNGRRLHSGYALVTVAMVTQLFSATGVLAGTETAVQAVPSASSPPASSTDEPGGPAYTEDGGAQAIDTTRTVPHWHGSFLDPTNGNTYGFNMVGSADPRDQATGATTVAADIVPLTFRFADGTVMDGGPIADKALASPVFQPGDYEASGDTGVQYEDAIMRSQFNRVGTGYHLQLQPLSAAPPVVIDVPANQGITVTNVRGILRGEIDYQFFSAQIQELLRQGSKDPTHLAVFLTDNVYLYVHDPSSCCYAGYHGAGKVPGRSIGSQHGNGNEPVQTYVWATWIRPGNYDPAVKPWVVDVSGLSHEIAEWADDPFIDNVVQPWRFPETPQACAHLLEVGDPVVHVGFHQGVNTGDQALPYADGTYHPEDEMFLPWFSRESPNRTSQPVQGGTNGRYSFLGAENPLPAARVPAVAC